MRTPANRGRNEARDQMAGRLKCPTKSRHVLERKLGWSEGNAAGHERSHRVEVSVDPRQDRLEARLFAVIERPGQVEGLGIPPTGRRVRESEGRIVA